MFLSKVGVELQVGIELEGIGHVPIGAIESKCKLQGLDWSLDIVEPSLGKMLRRSEYRWNLSNHYKTKFASL